MFHVMAFATSSPGTYGSLTAIPPATDPVAAISGNFLFVPALNNIFGAYALGTNILRAQFTSPSLLANVPFDVTPVEDAAAPAAVTQLLLQPSSPIPLVVDEPLSVLITTGGTSAETVIGFLSDGPVTQVTGNIIHVRGTITTGSTGYSWQNSALSLTNQLAEGTYNLVGCRIEGSHTIAARFVFSGSSNTVRPGLIASAGATGIHSDDFFRNGNLGVWGSFTNRVLPSVDYIGDGTGETATVILDVIKQ
jgi:hypothetical protein